VAWEGTAVAQAARKAREAVRRFVHDLMDEDITAVVGRGFAERNH